MFTALYNIYWRRSDMGNQPFEVSDDIKNQWQEIQVEEKTFLRNKASFQLFNFLVLSKLHSQQNVPQLIQRSIYSLPGTPRVIILNNQEGELFVLAQQFQHPLSSCTDNLILPSDTYHLLDKGSCIVHSLFKKYGPFHLKSSMIGLNRNMQIMVWVHSVKYKSEPEYPFEKSQVSEKIMIKQLLGVIGAQIKRRLQLLIPPQFCSSFEQFIRYVRSQAKRSKTQIMSHSPTKERQPQQIVRALSPQNSFGNIRMKLAKRISSNQLYLKGEKRNNVPKFIQKNKNKKQALLDSLNHRRTLTIQESQVFMQQKERFKPKGEDSPSKSSKSLPKVYNVKFSPTKNRNCNLSNGETSKVSQIALYSSQKFDCLSSTGSSNYYPVKKRQFSDLKSYKNLESTSTRKGAYSPKYPMTPPVFPGLSSLLEDNTESCVFQTVQNQTSHFFPTMAGSLNDLPVVSTSESKYISEIAKQQMIIEEQSHQNISKTLEDEMNDFFSNPSKSPRFMLGPMKQSVELAKEFSKIIDL